MTIRRLHGIVTLAALLASGGCAPFGHGTQKKEETHVVAYQPRAAGDTVGTGRRGLENNLYTLPLTPIQRHHPSVGKMRGRGSLSIGTTKDGFIVDCGVLPLSGDHHVVMTEQAARGTNCGTDELIAAILRAGSEVAVRSKGALLNVGNLSRIGGGDIPWSVSHNSGRDADLGFFLTGPDGSQVIPDTLVHLDRNGRGEVDGVEVRLDRKATWYMVRSLLTDKDIEVQWLFVAQWIREALLDYARSSGERPGLVSKAALAMAQPGWSNPHNDHIHLRIYCSRDDLLEGCSDWGSNRPWFVDRTRRIEARSAELHRCLRSMKPQKRAAAATVLARMGRREALPCLYRLLSDEESDVRVSAARAIREIGLWGLAKRVARRVTTMADDEAVDALLCALNRRLKGGLRVRVLTGLLDSESECSVDMGVFVLRRTVAEWALEQLAWTKEEDAVEALIGALNRPRVDVRSVHETLKRLTAHDPVMKDEEDDNGVIGAWVDWWDRNKGRERQEWYIAGFKAGAWLASDDGPAPDDIPALFEVLNSGGFRSNAALSLIVQATGRHMPRFPKWHMDPVPMLVKQSLEAWLARRDVNGIPVSIGRRTLSDER